MAFHPEVIAPAQANLLSVLGPLARRQQFYLGGGTAVALQLGHRRSEDLDWFTAEPLDDPLSLASELRDSGLNLDSPSVARGTLHGQINGARVSFIEYHYPLLEPTVVYPECACDLASLADLSCMKLAAVAQRGAKRDFLDVYALATGFAPLEQMLALYRRRYATDDTTHILYALAYFEDAEAEPDPHLLWPIDWLGVKTAVSKWVKALGQQS